MPTGKIKKEKVEIYPETPHLILCEGMDAYFFLMWFLDFLKKESPIFADFKVYDFGGISELKRYLPNIAKTGRFREVVKSICVVRDAERDASGAVQSIKNALRDSGFAVPDKPYLRQSDSSVSYSSIATGFVLFPKCDDNPQNGTLEDLCLNILAKEDAVSVLDNAADVLEKYKFRKPHKNRLHTYFSLTDEFVSMKIGEAARIGAFSFHGHAIDSLKAFLIKMHG